MSDAPGQTRDIMLSAAKRAMRAAEDEPSEVDLEPWLALQQWLEAGEHHVAIPYAEKLAAKSPKRRLVPLGCAATSKHCCR